MQEGDPGINNCFSSTEAFSLSYLSSFKMGPFIFQLTMVLTLVINVYKTQQFCCFQLHCFQLCKPKSEKNKRKQLQDPFPPIFCYNLCKKQISNKSFEKSTRIFVLTLKCQKYTYLEKILAL